ncbi:MAG: EVE domain-containing protein, partial [Muribaculaceae bacterium]|nr:EVE domain-containing protein [Muribaculaceae bacterium]
KYWSFSDLKDGQTVEYTVKNENGNKRRIPANFEQAKVGDIVIGYEATPVKSIVAIAEVVKASDGETISFKKVETLASPIAWSYFTYRAELSNMEFIKNPNGSFFKLTENEHDILMDIIRRDNPEDDNPVVKNSVTEAYGEKDFLSQVYMTASDYRRLAELLRLKMNVILQGAPGVGKTFTAKRLAYAMMGESDPSRVQIVQFHQNYSYEDFIMGYKPGESGFELVPGVFYEFCKRAAADDPERKYFFIIDEINRGNLSKIFGELLQLIEKSYRNQPIRLAYRKEEFAVPGNVYIIGMMNTADRSLAMIDYALRRRFSFFKMTPGFDTEGFKTEIAKHSDERIPKVVEAVRRLNETIINDDSLGEGFCIGHSYFCEQDPNADWIESVVYHDICPMLEEYWFDNKEKYRAETDRLLETLKK